MSHCVKKTFRAMSLSPISPPFTLPVLSAAQVPDAGFISASRGGLPQVATAMMATNNWAWD